MFVESTECYDISAKDAPKSVDNSSADSSAVEEIADGAVATSFTKNAGTKPGQEADVYAKGLAQCCRNGLG